MHGMLYVPFYRRINGDLKRLVLANIGAVFPSDCAPSAVKTVKLGSIMCTVA